MRRSSEHLERKAVELCNIHPDHHVLEVGFGAGDGLQFACDKVKGWCFLLIFSVILLLYYCHFHLWIT